MIFGPIYWLTVCGKNLTVSCVQFSSETLLSGDCLHGVIYQNIFTDLRTSNPTRFAITFGVVLTLCLRKKKRFEFIHQKCSYVHYMHISDKPMIFNAVGLCVFSHQSGFCNRHFIVGFWKLESGYQAVRGATLCTTDPLRMKEHHNHRVSMLTGWFCHTSVSTTAQLPFFSVTIRHILRSYRILTCLKYHQITSIISIQTNTAPVT